MVRNRDNILNIIDELEALSLRTSALVLELRAARLQEWGEDDPRRQRSPRATSPRWTPTFRHGYKDRDRAIITNRYLGQRGTQGTVTYITEQRVMIADQLGALPYTPGNQRT